MERMVMVNFVLIFLTLTVYSNAKFNCTKSTYCTIIIWAKWSDCSSGCGQGLRYRMPGMCCPNGVTVETIFEECAVKLCNMTESDYNQTEVCQSADKCSTATQQTIPLSTKLFSTTTRTSPPTRSTQRPSTINVVSLPLTSRSSIQAFPSSKHGEPVQDKNLALPRPFGIVTLLVISALVLATLTSVGTCIYFGVKHYKKRGRGNSIRPCDA